MKIAQVICLFGKEELSSGAVNIVNDLANHLSKNHRVFIFSGTRKDKKDKLCIDEALNYSWWHFNITPYLAPNKKENYFNELANKYFQEFLYKTSPDIIHFHALQGLGAGLIEIAIQEKIPFVVHLHDWWWFCPFLFVTSLDEKICSFSQIPLGCHCLDSNFLKNRFEYLSKILNSIDRFIAVSDFIKKTYVDMGISEYKITICPNPIPAFKKNKAYKGSSKVRFAYFGGHSVHKGFPTLKRAFEGLTGNFRIYCYGFDGKKKFFEQFLNIFSFHKKIKYLPCYVRTDLPYILSNIDVVIVPSLMLESFNLVVREVMSLGTPVIASKSGGPEEIIEHNKTGWLFERGNSDELKTIMQSLINDPDQIKQVKENIKNIELPLITFKEYLQKIETIYRQR